MKAFLEKGVLMIERIKDEPVEQLCINPAVYKNEEKINIGFCSYDCPLMGQPYVGEDDNGNKGYILECCSFSVFSEEPFTKEVR